MTNRVHSPPSGLFNLKREPEQHPARILCVEDSDGDFALVEQHLRQAKFDHKPVLHRAATLAEALVMLSQQNGTPPYDVVLLDLSLPDSFGPETYTALQKAAPDTAITILSGNTDHDLALAMVQHGAQDYLPKDDLSSDLLQRSILYAVERQRLYTGLVKLNEKLQRTTRELQSAQMQLIQAEKLESMGRLAAGIAHEVKNPLSVLQLGIDYLTPQQPVLDEKSGAVLCYMQDAITRADSIIHDMLNFSRAGAIEFQPCCPSAIAECALRMVNHDLIKRKITVVSEFSRNMPQVRGDARKLEQVLINILMNAAQAMPGGGHIKIRTYSGQIEEVRRNEGQRDLERLRQGDDVTVIEVRDHGPGIPDEVMSRLYEPFFTTKPSGEGTGLGLAVARRIIELHRGYLQITNMENPPGVRARIILKSDTPSHAHRSHAPPSSNGHRRPTALLAAT